MRRCVYNVVKGLDRSNRLCAQYNLAEAYMGKMTGQIALHHCIASNWQVECGKERVSSDKSLYYFELEVDVAKPGTSDT